MVDGALNDQLQEFWERVLLDGCPECGAAIEIEEVKASLDGGWEAVITHLQPTECERKRAYQ